MFFTNKSKTNKNKIKQKLCQANPYSLREKIGSKVLWRQLVENNEIASLYNLSHPFYEYSFSPIICYPKKRNTCQVISGRVILQHFISFCLPEKREGVFFNFIAFDNQS